SLGRRQAAMPAWENVLSVQDRWDVVSYLWSLTADLRQPLADVRRQADAAVTAYHLGERDAAELAADAYLSFEPLEARLGVDDPEAVRGVEAAFLRLRTALRRPAAGREVDEAAGAVGDALQGAASTRGPCWKRSCERSCTRTGTPRSGTASNTSACSAAAPATDRMRRSSERSGRGSGPDPRRHRHPHRLLQRRRPQSAARQSR